MIETVIGSLLNINTIVFMNVGLLVGIIFGAIPGLTTVLAVVLFTPMTFGMEPVAAMMLLLGIYCGGTYGGSITAILINTPGTPAASATVIDGYPLAQMGKAKKALDMSLIASVIGGLISAFVLLTAAPQIAKATLLFGPPEYFALAVFGLSIIISVSGKNMTSGIIGGCIGILVACVGVDVFSGVTRFTFNVMDLSAGIDLLIMMIGVFAIVEIVNKVISVIKKGDRIDNISVNDRVLGSEEGVLFSEFKRCIITIIRSALIGTGIGAMPGTGAALSSFISYDVAKKRSKVRHNFGKGEIEGVAATESGNNGATGATLIPLLTLGIPGDTVTAVMIGALTIHGLVPGPNLFVTSGDKIYAIMYGLIIINLFMFVQGKIILRFASKVSKLSDTILIPIIAIFCSAGAYAVRNSTFDVLLIAIIGIIGYLFNKLKIPILPLVLGAVIGPIAEANFRRSMSMSQNGGLIFLTRPISLVFIALTVIFVFVTLHFARKERNENGNT